MPFRRRASSRLLYFPLPISSASRSLKASRYRIHFSHFPSPYVTTLHQDGTLPLIANCSLLIEMRGRSYRNILGIPPTYRRAPSLSTAAYGVFRYPTSLGASATKTPTYRLVPHVRC
jgi:hypothetical protein